MGELELLKIIAVRAAVLVVRLEGRPSVAQAPAIESALRELHHALDRLDDFKGQERFREVGDADDAAG